MLVSCASLIPWKILDVWLGKVYAESSSSNFSDAVEVSDCACSCVYVVVLAEAWKGGKKNGERERE
jgi:hypothetical protein